MKRRTLTSIALVVCISMIFSSSVFAASNGETGISDSISVTEYEPAVPVNTENATIVTLPATAEFLSESATQEVIPDFDRNLPVSSTESTNTSPISMKTRSGNNSYHFSGTIAQEGGTFIIYPITLYNNQNMHAELIGPQSESLDYVLLLYTVDANGNLLQKVDGCTYAKASGIPQTVAVRNAASTGVKYALIVLSRAGGSATATFDVNITLGTGGDPGESNDNAYTAFSVGTLGASGISVSGTTLDSPKDVDWFVFSTPALTDFKGVRITSDSALNAKVTIQLYYASGSTMVENKPVNGVYNLSKGTNYLRVVDNGNSFTSGDVSYNIAIAPVFYASQAAYTISLDNMLGSTSHYDTFPTQTYRVPINDDEYAAETRYTLTDGCSLTWTATYLSASGYLCKEATDTLFIRIIDTAWSNPDLITTQKTENKVVNGVLSVTIKAPPAFSQISMPVGEYSYSMYDYSCTLEMTSSSFGSYFSGGSTPIFISSKIWS